MRPGSMCNFTVFAREGSVDTTPILRSHVVTPPSLSTKTPAADLGLLKAKPPSAPLSPGRERGPAADADRPSQFADRSPIAILCGVA